MIVLTEEQQQKLDSGRAVEVTDTQTLRPYVVLGRQRGRQRGHCYSRTQITASGKSVG